MLLFTLTISIPIGVESMSSCFLGLLWNLLEGALSPSKPKMAQVLIYGPTRATQPLLALHKVGFSLYGTSNMCRECLDTTKERFPSPESEEGNRS